MKLRYRYRISGAGLGALLVVFGSLLASSLISPREPLALPLPADTP